MFNVGSGEMVAIFVIALVFLGPDKLPNAARQAGKYMADFKRISSGFQQELREAMDVSGTSGSTSSPTSMLTPADDPLIDPEPAVPTVADVPDGSVSDVPDTSAPTAPSRPTSINGNGNGASDGRDKSNGRGHGSRDGGTTGRPAIDVVSPPVKIQVDGPSGSFS